MKSHWIMHHGKQVFLAEYSHFADDSEALRLEVEAAVNLLAQEPPNSVLVVVNMEGTSPSVANANILRQLLPISVRAVKRRAVLGMSGIKRFFISNFAAVAGKGSLTPFDSLDAALEWIIQD